MMTLRLGCATALALVMLCGFARAQEGSSAARADASQQLSAAEKAAIDDGLQRLFALELAPGASVVAVRGDRVVLRRDFGYADLEAKRKVDAKTVFYIASSTKSFTGTMASLLHERGTIDLDKQIAKYLAAPLAEGVDAERVTLRSLLTHTHGLANSGPVTFRLAFSGEHDPELLRKLLRHHGASGNGSTFRYSNIGYNVATLALEDALDTDWKSLLEASVLKPLGMKSSSTRRSRVDDRHLAWPYREDPAGFTRLPYTKGDANMHSAGGMLTTSSDLGRWLIANLNGGKIDGKQALPQKVIARAHKPYAEQDRRFGPFVRKGYGLGWNTGKLDGDACLHHFGGFSGFHAHVSFLPARKLGVAILANSSRFGGLFAVHGSQLIYDVLRGRAKGKKEMQEALARVAKQVQELRGRLKADRDRRAKRDQKLPRPLSAYTGSFENPLYGRITLELAQGKLVARMGRLRSAVEVYDAKREALRVELTGGGTVVATKFVEGQPKAVALRALGLVFRRRD